MTWPPRSGHSALTALVRTWQSSIFQPTTFFRSLPIPHPLGPAILYFLLIGIPAVGVTLFWRTLFTMIIGALGLATSEVAPAGMGGWWPVLQFLLSPLFLLLGLGISFLTTHLLLVILGGARRGAGMTLRVLCFSYGPALFAIVPFIGSLVGGIWTIVLAIIGLREGHQTDGWRAATAVLLPLLAILLLGIAAAVVIGVLASYLAL